MESHLNTMEGKWMPWIKICNLSNHKRTLKKWHADHWPFYFFLPKNFLRRKDATRCADEREPIDIDWQSCQLAQFLRENDIKAWLKNSSNSFTLMSLARMINLMNNLHVSQPSCQAPLDIERSHQSARKNPKRMARFQSLFNEMEQVILRKMRPIFLKYADLIPDLLQHFQYK